MSEVLAAQPETVIEVALARERGERRREARHRARLLLRVEPRPWREMVDDLSAVAAAAHLLKQTQVERAEVDRQGDARRIAAKPRIEAPHGHVQTRDLRDRG